MENMIRSMARFSAAVTLFGFQQFQNVLQAFADSADALKIRQSLDAVTDAIASELGDEAKPAYDSMVRLSNQVVDRTFDTLRKAQPGRKKTEPRDNADEAAGASSDQGAASQIEEVELATD